MSSENLLPFTFGVEFEFVFAILKASVYDAGDRRKYPRGILQSWIAPRLSTILADRGCEVLVHGIDDTSAYEQWFLAYELGCRLQPRKLRTLSPDPRLNTASEKYWYHDGLELVSRVMRIPSLVGRRTSSDSSLTEVKMYLEALENGANGEWFCRTTEKCGVHVHIGIPDDDETLSQIPLSVLQHLAYILLEYEDVISCLHHPRRRGFYGSDNIYIGTNKLGINQHQHVCNQYNAATDTIRDKIFDEHMTEEKLGELMGSQLEFEGYDESKRYKFVNWEHIRRFNSEKRSSRAATVEFRQHRGSLDFKDVSQWVRFLTALMRVAERRANEATPPNSPSFPPISRSPLTFSQREGRKYRFRCSRFQNRLEELFDLLGLDRMQTQYWTAKLREYNAHEFIKRPYTRLCVSCNALDQLKDPEAYFRFCKSLESIDASIDGQRRASGRGDTEWTEEDARLRDERIAAANGEMLNREDNEDGDLHTPRPARRTRIRKTRTGPYDREVDPQARTRAGRKASASSDSFQGDFFELKDVPRRGGKRGGTRSSQ